MFGQITDDVRTVSPRLADLWERWHLNDLRAGCEHQEDVKRADPDWRERLPVGDSCPVCGYRYGSEWRYEPVPDEVLTEILELLGV